MLNRRFVTLLLTLCGSLTALDAHAQDKVVLRHKPKVGEVTRYQTDGTMSMDIMGMKMTMEMRQVEKATVIAVAANGEVTVESQLESMDMSVNGMKQPAPDDLDKKSTTVHRADGSLVSMKSASMDADSAKLEARMYNASSAVFTDKPVGVGDKWTRDFTADSAVGIPAAKGQYEIVGAEKIKDLDTFKIKAIYKESDGSPLLSTSATYWVEKATGDTIQAEFEFENVPFGGPGAPPVSGKMKQERLNAGDKGQPKKDKNIDETVKDYEKMKGFVTLYKKRDAGRDTVYMEIPEALLGKQIMMEVTASTGTSQHIVAGDPINDILFQFERVQDDKLQMVVPRMGFKAESKLPISRAVDRSFVHGIIEQFKIEAKQEDRKSLLINVSSLFSGDIAGISQALSGGGGGLQALLGGGGGGFGMDREKTYVAAYKVFPENMVVETQYHFTGARRGGLGPGVLADPRSLPLRVVYTVFPLKDEGYRPRIADPRVGYFQTGHQDFSRDDKDEQDVNYILRWNVQKADPAAKMSPPKKPIVFWLDNAIPTEYRDAVRRGLLFWNKAFERIGIKDAIVVKQMPDNADWDHADMRYNVIRWVASPAEAYAVALFRPNPITGEILNASITVDAGIVKYTKTEHDKIVSPASYFEDKPLDLPAYKPFDPSRCQLGKMAREQAWFGLQALTMLSPLGFKVDVDAYTRSFITDVVSHEMGHIMGLRHNFIASTQYNLKQLGDSKAVRTKGVSASVMDYNPFNISAIKHPGVPYFAETVGPYDLWAIEYGYKPIDAKTPEGELSKLRALASKCNEPGHLYQSDEVADSFDPAVTRFDLSANPLDYHARMLQVSRYMLLKLGDRVPRKGESFWEFTKQFNLLMNVYSRAASTASRYLGALHVNRNHKGDAGERPTLVPAAVADQKRALGLLNTYLFAENALTFPTTYYTHMTVNPNQDMISAFLAGGGDYPVKDMISSLQSSALRRTFSASVLRRVSNNEFKMGPNASLTMPELFQSVTGNVWSEAAGGRKVNVLRRQLQRTYLDTMSGMITGAGAPEDARMMAWDSLRKLQGTLRTAKGRGSLDTYTKVHYEECLSRIARVLDAKQVIGMTSGGGGQSLLEMLLGGQQK